MSLITVVVGAYNGTSRVRVATTIDVGFEPKKIIFSLPVSRDLRFGRIKWMKLIMAVINHFQGTHYYYYFSLFRSQYLAK